MFLHFALSLLVQLHVQRVSTIAVLISHRRFNTTNFSIISDGVFFGLVWFCFERVSRSSGWL